MATVFISFATVVHVCLPFLLLYELFVFPVIDSDFPYKNVSMQRLKGHIDGRYIVCEQVGQ